MFLYCQYQVYFPYPVIQIVIFLSRAGVYQPHKSSSWSAYCSQRVMKIMESERKRAREFVKKQFAQRCNHAPPISSKFTKFGEL